MLRFLTLGVLAIGLGCDTSATGPLIPAWLSLTVSPEDGPEPSATSVRAVRLVVRHWGGRAVALSGCPRAPSVRIERFETGKWREGGSSGLVCLAIYSTETVALVAGGRMEKVISVNGPGRYRFVVPIGPSAAIPERELRSAAIALR